MINNIPWAGQHSRMKSITSFVERCRRGLFYNVYLFFLILHFPHLPSVFPIFFFSLSSPLPLLPPHPPLHFLLFIPLFFFSSPFPPYLYPPLFFSPPPPSSSSSSSSSSSPTSSLPSLYPPVLLLLLSFHPLLCSG